MSLLHSCQYVIIDLISNMYIPVESLPSLSHFDAMTMLFSENVCYHTPAYLTFLPHTCIAVLPITHLHSCPSYNTPAYIAVLPTLPTSHLLSQPPCAPHTCIAGLPPTPAPHTYCWPCNMCSIHTQSPDSPFPSISFDYTCKEYGYAQECMLCRTI